MSGYSDIEIKLQILDILGHHLKTYRYRGEPGQEYSVIQSIFVHLNSLPMLSNIHIRWYSVIVFLIRSFHGYHTMGNRAIPSLITPLESFTEEIARLGIWLSTKKGVEKEWINNRVTDINKLLVQLIELPLWDEQAGEASEVFRLATLRASENSVKLSHFSGSENGTLIKQTLRSIRFQSRIQIPVDRMPAEKKQDLTNMDDFWNGFIP